MHSMNSIRFWSIHEVLRVHTRNCCAPDASAPQQQKHAAAAPKRLLLVLNTGSLSLKFKLYAQNSACGGLHAEVTGLIERIGEMDKSRMIVKMPLGDGPSHETCTIDRGFQDHAHALAYALQHVREEYAADFADDVLAVGHRVVHGRNICETRLVDDGLLQTISDAAVLAPQDNPAGLQGIAAAAAAFSCPQVVAFDTAYIVSSMPPAAFTYALPTQLADHYGIRRYGAHGVSYQYLTAAACQMLGTHKPNLIIAHLGAGSSVAAVSEGRIFDTSMGFSPLEGLMMSTRCGDIDLAVAGYLAVQGCMTSHEVDDILTKQSGFLGMTGFTDMRAIAAAAESGDGAAQLAIEVYVHSARKYFGAYLLELRGLTDAIIFSAGIGENSPLIRRLTLEGLEPFGIQLHDAKNQAATGERADIISDAASQIKVFVLPTDEERCIAEQDSDKRITRSADIKGCGGYVVQWYKT